AGLRNRLKSTCVCGYCGSSALAPLSRAVFLRIAHVLGLGGLDNSSSSEGATVHGLGASAPGPGDTSKEAFSSPGGATGASRGRALLSPRLGLGTGKGRGRLGTSWGFRLQAMNCRRYAAGENTDHLQPVNPRLWAACGRCECKPLYSTRWRSSSLAETPLTLLACPCNFIVDTWRSR